MHILRCTIKGPESGPFILSIQVPVSRPLPGRRRGEAASTQTLLAWGSQLQPLAGADAHSGLEVGPPLQLYADPAPRGGESAAAWRPYVAPVGFGTRCSVWDPFSSAVYMSEGCAVVRLSGDDTVKLVAGDSRERGDADGSGTAARFYFPERLVSDGAGSLYLAQETCIRRLELPGSRVVGPGAALRGPHATEGVGLGAVGGASGEVPGDQASAAAVEDEVLVSTLALEAADHIYGLAFVGGSSSCCSKASGSLLFATSTALYRLPLDDPAAVPLLMAGAEGVKGSADGLGADARFTSIGGIVLDGEGRTYMGDSADDADTTAVRRVAADGTVDTIATGIAGICYGIAILPNGCLALSMSDGLHVMSLGLKPPPVIPAAPAPTGPPPRTLPGDLGALLSRQPDGTADVTIVVGGRTFHVHRMLLSARCDYFRPRLGGEFADGSAQQLDLPDADPDAFEVLLLFVYTGAADIPDVLAAGVAELADRLLLPELCEQAAAVVEASVSARTVARLLLWAEARGPPFAGLLSRLKGWYVENHEAVMREAKEQVALLMAQSPGLMLELMGQLPSKRQRTH